jgi:hypothetical protein
VRRCRCNEDQVVAAGAGADGAWLVAAAVLRAAALGRPRLPSTALRAGAVFISAPPLAPPSAPSARVFVRPELPAAFEARAALAAPPLLAGVFLPEAFFAASPAAGTVSEPASDAAPAFTARFRRATFFGASSASEGAAVAICADDFAAPDARLDLPLA